MQHHEEMYEVNPFKPKEGSMVDELAVIVAILVGWGLLNFGFQALLSLLAESTTGDGMLTRLTFLSFPFHFWFTGQFLPLWFVVLCVIFNLYTDRVTERHSHRRDRTYE
jgi:putative solute:sodium symporter small subunit